MSSIGTTSVEGAGMAIRKREPSAAGAYNPPNSGTSKTADAGATDGALPAR